MANESSKSRLHFNDFEKSILRGTVLDIGAGGDPVVPHAKSFDVEDGDANHISDYVKEQYDCVYSSHCLEHMDNPYQAIRAWFDLVKPGGYLFVIVPDEDLYEQGVFPSRFNPDHKHTFTIAKKHSWCKNSINVLSLCSSLPDGNVVNVALNDAGYNRSIACDQTEGGALAQIEFVVRKNILKECQAPLPESFQQCALRTVQEALNERNCENLLLRSENARLLAEISLLKANQINAIWLTSFAKIIRGAYILLRNPKLVVSLAKKALYVAGEKKRKKNIHLLILYEHIGDLVACEPIFRHYKMCEPGSELVLITSEKYRQIVEYNELLSEVIYVESYTECIFLKKAANILYVRCTDLHFGVRVCNKYQIANVNSNALGINQNNYYHFGGLLNAFSLAAGLGKLDAAPKFWFDPKIQECMPTTEKFVVIHCTSNEEERNWRADKWREVIKWLTLKGYVVVEVGLDSSLNLETGGYINLCGKKTLQGYAAIIKNACMFIGVDSGFAHIANALDIFGVILIGKYRDFVFHNPYSGRYTKADGCTIVYSESRTADIAVDCVLQALEEKMSRLGNETE